MKGPSLPVAALILLLGCFAHHAHSVSLHRNEVEFLGGSHFRGINNLRQHEPVFSAQNPRKGSHSFSMVDDDGVEVKLHYEGVHHADLIIIDKMASIVQFHCEADHSRLVLYFASPQDADNLFFRQWKERPIFTASHNWNADCSSEADGGAFIVVDASVPPSKTIDATTGYTVIEYASASKGHFFHAFEELKMVFHSDDANGDKTSTMTDAHATRMATRLARMNADDNHHENWMEVDNEKLGIAAVGRTMTPYYSNAATASWNYNASQGAVAQPTIQWYTTAGLPLVQVNCLGCFAYVAASLTVSIDFLAAPIVGYFALNVTSAQVARFKVQPQIIVDLSGMQGSTTFKPASPVFSAPLYGGTISVLGVPFGLSISFEAFPSLTVQNGNGRLEVTGGFLGSFNQQITLGIDTRLDPIYYETRSGGAPKSLEK